MSTEATYRRAMAVVYVLPDDTPWQVTEEHGRRRGGHMTIDRILTLGRDTALIALSIAYIVAHF